MRSSTQLFSFTVSVVIATASSCGYKQEEYINKSFNSVWFHDVTSAALCVAKLRCASPNGASARCCLRVGDATFEICCLACVLVLWVYVWSDSFLFARPWISALPRHELGIPPNVTLPLTSQAVLEWIHQLPDTWELATSIGNKPKPFVILVNDQGPGPRARG